MIKREITWTNFADEEVTREYYFHITKAEAVEEFLGFIKGGDANDFGTILKEVIASKDSKKIVGHFKTLLTASVGLRSADNRLFIKDEATTREFQFSGAMDELLMWMFQNADGAAAFIMGMFPAEFVKNAEDQGLIKDGRIVSIELTTEASPFPGAGIVSVTPVEEKDDRPAWIRENRDPTKNEMMVMSKEQFQEIWLAKQAKAGAE